MTHDYKRNGTTPLFAALDVATGTVLGRCLPRHWHEEFLVFLRTIDRKVPKARLATHPRFLEFTDKNIRRGSFPSVPDL